MHDDLVRRRFVADAPNRLWLADITEHSTREGKVYCAAVLDVYSRRVVGWSIADHLRAELVVDALEMARWRRRPPVGQTVVHSDRTMLLRLPRMERDGPRVHNGPAMAGHGAEAVLDAIATAITTLPQQLRRSLTLDQGAEMAQHAQLRIDTGVAIYFCDPRSPWQRGTNQNTNGLLRQYFPKGTDLSRHSVSDIEAVAAAINSRPRATLGWETPAKALDDHLCSLQQGGVATTP